MGHMAVQSKVPNLMLQASLTLYWDSNEKQHREPYEMVGDDSHVLECAPLVLMLLQERSLHFTPRTSHALYSASSSSSRTRSTCSRHGVVFGGGGGKVVRGVLLYRLPSATWSIDDPP